MNGDNSSIPPMPDFVDPALGFEDVRADLPAPLLEQAEGLPPEVLVFPLRRAVGFPGLVMPVLVENEYSAEIVEQAKQSGSYLALILRRQPDEDGFEEESCHEFGVLVKIHKVMSLPDGNKSALCQGIHRIEVRRYVQVHPYPVAEVAYPTDLPGDEQRVEALFRTIGFLLDSIIEKNPNYGDEFRMAAMNVDAPGNLADFAAAYFIRPPEEKQAVLESVNIEERLYLVAEILTREQEILEIGQQIQKEIQSKIEKAQKEYYLREQLKIIRRELGEEKDRAEREREEFERRIKDAEMPEEVEEKAKDELDRLATIPVESAEYSVVRTYLDWLVDLPWERSSEDCAKVETATRVLDEDHYGLDEVKERILEFLGVRQLRPGHHGPILCLVGPPGVGKTSLGRSIARATNRKFVRFSLGGMSDEAEIKGHRRTYIGALPGRIIQMLRQAGTNNPVLMLDELDKLGRDFRGDPSSALLEVLDPEQNHTFLDHYLDVPFDLSKVMFVATANVLDMIPEPLRDRMEVIEIPGYITAEKVQIAKRYLLPKQLENHGLKASQLKIPVATLRATIEQYTREAGVRGLEKSIARVCRKHALAVARGRRTHRSVDPSGLPEFLGPPAYSEELERRPDKPGVVTGLAWTGFGGSLLTIEVVVWKGDGKFDLTGRLGEVMGESVRIAYDYVRSHAERYGIDLEQLARSNFHIHFPAGAVPKDGPSAGITITTAILSLLLGKVLRSKLAMTGELTLVGEVLPVGGIREKVLAAKRFGIKTVLLPEANRKDVEELREEMVRGLRFVYVSHYDEVFAHVFPRAGRKFRAPDVEASSGKKRTPKRRAKKARKKAARKAPKKPRRAAKRAR